MASLGFRLRRALRKLQWERVRGGPGRPPRILTVRTENGLLSFSNMDRIIAKVLYVHRAWEVDLMERAVSYLRREGYLAAPGRDFMIDAGANIGMVSIGMLRRGYFRSALAIEPGPENFALLERNIAQNGLTDSIRAVACAVSDASGDVNMELSEDNFGDHRVRAAAAHRAGRLDEERRATIRVPARTLDDIVDEEPRVDPQRIGLVWADVQGHEGHLLLGARKTLAGGAPVLTEFWPYGIERSGFERDRYLDLVRTLFDRVMLVDASANRFDTLSTAALAAHFDARTDPHRFWEILLLPRR